METKQKKTKVVISVLALAALMAFSFSGYAGKLEPSAPPGPTMKTLDEVEPRIPVQSLGGDANSLYVISQPGSYYLTGNITGEPNKDGIMITANNVTVDLMGFSLIGMPCSGRGIVKVIDQASPQLHSYPVRIRNGTICNWGGNGMYFEEIKVTYNGGSGVGTSGELPPKILMPCHLYLEGVSVHNNGSDGIRVHNALAHMEDVSFTYNGGHGMRITGMLDAYQVLVSHNGGNGIDAVDGFLKIDGGNVSNNDANGLCLDGNSCCHIEDVTFTYNNGDGMHILGMMTNVDAYSGYASHNGGNGMYVNAMGEGYIHMEQVSFNGNDGNGVEILGMMTNVDAYSGYASHNGGGGIIIQGGGNLNQCTVVGNGGSGIEVSTGSTVRNCTARGNTGDGIVVSSNCRVIGNSCESNGEGVIGAAEPAGIHATGSGNRIEDNHVIGNNIGIDVDSTGNLIIKNSAQGNSTNYDIALGNTAGPTLGTGDIVSDNPHANYEF